MAYDEKLAGKIIDDQAAEIVHLRAEHEWLHAEIGRLKDDLVRMQGCQTCGTPLSRDCARCERLWAS